MELYGISKANHAAFLKQRIFNLCKRRNAILLYPIAGPAKRAAIGKLRNPMNARATPPCGIAPDSRDF